MVNMRELFQSLILTSNLHQVFPMIIWSSHLNIFFLNDLRFFFFYIKTNLRTHGGFEPVTYRKECLNKAPIHRQSKPPWAKRSTSMTSREYFFLQYCS